MQRYLAGSRMSGALSQRAIPSPRLKHLSSPRRRSSDNLASAPCSFKSCERDADSNISANDAQRTHNIVKLSKSAELCNQGHKKPSLRSGTPSKAR